MRSNCDSSTVNFIHVKGKSIRSRCDEVADAKTEKWSYSAVFLHPIISVELEVRQSSFRRLLQSHGQSVSPQITQWNTMVKDGWWTIPTFSPVTLHHPDESRSSGQFLSQDCVIWRLILTNPNMWMWIGNFIFLYKIKYILYLYSL